MKDSTIGKHGGNSESNAAWGRAKFGAKAMCGKIYRAIKHNEKNCGFNEGCTAKEVAEAFGKPLHTISGRFSDLEETGMLRRTQWVRDGSRAWTAIK